MDQLKKRGFQLASRCPLCQKAEEGINNLLIHYSTVWGLWTALISFTRVDWARPFLVKDLMMSWTTFPIKKKARKLWKAALSSLFWVILKERNRNVFL